jgi:hypothetical protein
VVGEISILLNYPDGTSELTPEETEFILGEKQTLSTFFGIDIEGLSFIELLSINTGIYLNQFRALNEGLEVLRKVRIPENRISDIIILEHNHYSRIINLGMGFLAVKCVDPDPVYHIRNDRAFSHRRLEYFVVDPYDNSMSLNNIRQVIPLESYLEINYTKKTNEKS